MTTKGSKYAVCPKCGVRYSTLTRHRCFKPAKQKDKAKLEDAPPEGDGSGGMGGGDGDGEQDQKDQQDQQQEGKGEGQGEGEDGNEGGDGQQGEGEGQQGQGQGEQQDGEGEGEGQGQQEEEIPPAAVVVTVLKYAFLTAQSLGRKSGNLLSVHLTEPGLKVIGMAKGGKRAESMIPWGEFEKRATLDGEMYVREIIEEVDNELRG